MRKVVMGMMTTLNGRLDDPDAWMTEIPDDLYAEIDRLYGTFDTILVGRRTYEEMFEYWPGAETAEDGSEINKVSRPVLLGTRIVSGYIGYREHVVQPGETLSGIAQDHYGSPLFQRLVRANAHQIDDPDLIFPGQVIRVPIGTG